MGRIQDEMKRLAFVLILTIAGCGYDGHYRYECQEPSNWDSEECNPPLCRVDGACSKDLIGFDPDEQVEEQTETPQTTETVAP